MYAYIVVDELCVSLDQIGPLRAATACKLVVEKINMCFKTGAWFLGFMATNHQQPSAAIQIEIGSCMYFSYTLASPAK